MLMFMNRIPIIHYYLYLLILNLTDKHRVYNYKADTADGYAIVFKEGMLEGRIHYYIE